VTSATAEPHLAQIDLGRTAKRS